MCVRPQSGCELSLFPKSASGPLNILSGIPRNARWLGDYDRRMRRTQSMLRLLAAALFVVAGANHFRNPDFYAKIIPPIFPARRTLVAVSGVCEIIGGLCLLIRRLRTAAGWGLLALLVAVFPANVYMAVAPQGLPHGNLPIWLLWLRLPMQAVLIGWVWWVSLARPSSDRDPSREKSA